MASGLQFFQTFNIISLRCDGPETLQRCEDCVKKGARQIPRKEITFLLLSHKPWRAGWVFLFVCFAVMGFELRAYTLSHSASSFL
jgi:hypothetical protein